MINITNTHTLEGDCERQAPVVLSLTHVPATRRVCHHWTGSVCRGRPRAVWQPGSGLLHTLPAHDPRWLVLHVLRSGRKASWYAIATYIPRDQRQPCHIHTYIHNHSSSKKLTKTLGSKCPAVDWLIVVHCSSVKFATIYINTTMSLYTASQLQYIIFCRNCCISHAALHAC